MKKQPKSEIEKAKEAARKDAESLTKTLDREARARAQHQEAIDREKLDAFLQYLNPDSRLARTLNGAAELYTQNLATGDETSVQDLIAETGNQYAINAWLREVEEERNRQIGWLQEQAANNAKEIERLRAQVTALGQIREAALEQVGKIELALARAQMAEEETA